MPIQIIPKARSFGEEMGAGLGGGFGQGFSSEINKAIEAKRESKKLSEANESLKNRFGIDLTGINDPKQRQEVLKQRLKDIATENKTKRDEDYLNSIFGKQNQQSDEVYAPGITKDNSMNKNSSGFNVKNLSSEDLARVSALNPNVGRSLQHSQDVSLREDRENKKLDYEKDLNIKKEVKESHRDNKDYINQTYDKYEDSLRREAILGRMNELEESGELSDSGTINLLEQLGLNPEWLKNPENEEYNKLGLDLLGGGTLQADYGSRVLASEFKVSQQRIPTLSQTPEGRKQISANIKTMMLPAKLKQERLQYYLDKAERTGEPLPQNLRGRILKDIQPQLEEAADAFKQRNGRYKVKDGTYPDDNALEKYYFISNGDTAKAKEIMKEDGYDVR